MYLCNWRPEGGLPPAHARWAGASKLRDGDCRACPHYEVAGAFLARILDERVV